MASTSTSTRSPSPSRYQSSTHVDDLVGVLVDHLLAGGLLDLVPQVLVDVVVLADLLHDHAGL